MDGDLFQRIEAAVPQVLSWIEDYLATHSRDVRSVYSLDNPRLTASFPEDLLRRAMTGAVDVIDYPPVLSIPEFIDPAPEKRLGVTFKNTYFLLSEAQSEDLHFHELVHVVQWEYLGPSRFLLVYGLGLAEFGALESPLEAIAYSLQQKFYEGFYRPNLKEYIEVQAEIAWRKVERLRVSLLRV